MKRTNQYVHNFTSSMSPVHK